MAIPFYIPPGIGPVRQHYQQPYRHHQENQFVRHHQNRDTGVDLTSLPRRLIQDLCTLYRIIFDNYLTFQMDNQGAGANLQRRGSTLLAAQTGQPLPDLIQCHASLTLDLTVTRTTVTRSNSRGSRRPGPDRGTRRPSSTPRSGPAPSTSAAANDSSSDEEEVTERFSAQAKAQVGPWQRTGIELRAIADRFQLEHSNNRRVVRQNTSFSFRVALNVGLPTAVLLGVGIGIAWFWN